MLGAPHKYKLYYMLHRAPFSSLSYIFMCTLVIGVFLIKINHFIVQGKHHYQTEAFFFLFLVFML